jgi:hypothetical protein
MKMQRWRVIVLVIVTFVIAACVFAAWIAMSRLFEHEFKLPFW